MIIHPIGSVILPALLALVNSSFSRHYFVWTYPRCAAHNPLERTGIRPGGGGRLLDSNREGE